MTSSCLVRETGLSRRHSFSRRSAAPLFESLDVPGYRGKDSLDRCLALLLLMLSLPLLLVLMLLVKLTSRGPALYRQTRMGLGGRLFVLCKLRTMAHDCERHTGARWCQPGDGRVTLLGRFLRRLHLDELPQLWNILRGEMSLVGPRPERPEFVSKLERALPDYRSRLAVRPGLSGLAQVQLPADTDLGSVRRKLAYDLYYIDHLSIGLDLRILLCTALHVAAIPCQVLWSLLIPGPAAVEDRHASNGSHLAAAEMELAR